MSKAITFQRALLVVFVLFALTYGSDYLQIRYRIWRDRNPYGIVTIQILYAISEKGAPGTNKTEYISGGAQDVPCVNSIFPHFGYSPCWYLKRKPERRISI